MRSWLTSFYHSLWDAEWLKIQTARPGRAVGYFVILNLLLTVAVSVSILPGLPAGLARLRSTVEREVPEFEAKLKNGELVISGLPQPCIAREQAEREGGAGRMTLVIDTDSTNTPALETFLTSDDLGGFLVARDRVEVFDRERGETQEYPWKNVPDYTLTRGTIVGWVATLSQPWAIALLMLVFIIFVFLGQSIAGLLYILFSSALVYVVARIAGKNWRFGWLFTAGLYAITLPVIIGAVFEALQVNIPAVEFLALTALLLALVFTKDASTPTVVTPNTPAQPTDTTSKA